jgi:hypothetical protein
MYLVLGNDGEAAIKPLSPYALANRLSYFLWASMPDKELMSLADSGEILKPEVIVAQTRRMLQHENVRGWATEFGANWLDVRRFEEHNAVDRERFPMFTNELRAAMFEEPIQFLMNAAKEDESILDFLYGNYTFANPVLAKHYGFSDLAVGANDWVRVDDVNRFHRGGLLAMSVFLTKNSPGLRTSPVKRGYWVVRRLIGEHIPAPPPDVPVLPPDESKLGDLTLRQALEKHREDKNCAICHQRFDSFGLVFEGFGPIGEVRDRDLGNRPVETTAVFPDGTEGTGVEGLRKYFRDVREKDFVDNMCKQLLTYALGRSLLPSDEHLLEETRKRLQANGYRFGSMVECIVTSQQFMNRRGHTDLARNSIR